MRTTLLNKTMTISMKMTMTINIFTTPKMTLEAVAVLVMGLA